MRTNKYILLAATLLGLSSCGNKKGDYDASGTFEATEVIVSSEANGKIMQFNIEEGQLLKADEEVGCIDTLQLYLKKMQLLASGKAIASKSTDINKQIAATKEQIGKAEYERNSIIPTIHTIGKSRSPNIAIPPKSGITEKMHNITPITL